MRLEARLAALEARSMPADGLFSQAEGERLAAAIEALNTVYPIGTDSKPLTELLERMSTNTTTEADKTMLNGLPHCAWSPHKLVRISEELSRLV